METDDLKLLLDRREKEERGRCDSCDLVYINGVRCHEIGCPRQARLHRLRVAVAYAD
jgi:hypothetical protein